MVVDHFVYAPTATERLLECEIYWADCALCRLLRNASCAFCAPLSRFNKVKMLAVQLKASDHVNSGDALF